MRETVCAFLDRANDPNAVEVLVRLHVGDIASLEAVSDLPVRLVVGGDTGGYVDIYRYVNCLAALARGDWLWCASDRMRVCTYGWDSILTKLDATKCQLRYPRLAGTPDWRVPVISRAFYSALGHVGLSAHSDCYIDALAGLARIRLPVGIDLEHVQCARSAARDISTSWAEYRSEANSRLFAIDKQKLAAVTGARLGSWLPCNAPENP